MLPNGLKNLPLLLQNQKVQLQDRKFPLQDQKMSLQDLSLLPRELPTFRLGSRDALRVCCKCVLAERTVRLSMELSLTAVGFCS